MMEQLSDNDLILRMRNGDTGALGVLYMRYSAAVSEFAFRFIRNREEVADITHNIFCKLWDERSTLHNVYEMKGYLFSMTRNAIFNELRHRKVVCEWETEVKLTGDIHCDDTDSAISTSDLLEMINLHIEHMPDLRRRIFCMSRYENMTHAEIAEKLNVSQKTVEYHIGIALKELRKLLKVMLIFV